jgi:hypothetical protein
MKLHAAILSALVLLTCQLLLADGEEEVSYADLVAKAAEYEGKTIKLDCTLLISGSEVLAVAEATEKDGELSFDGDAIYLRGVKSSIKKSLSKAKYNKRTSYYGPAVITGVVATGEFGRKKEYKIQIKAASVEVSAGGGSGEFEVLKKNVRHKADLPPEQDIIGARQAVRRDGFNPPTFPDYHDGDSLADNTQVLCITDGRESKVYTIGSMGTCELVNDKIGKVPVAVTW